MINRLRSNPYLWSGIIVALIAIIALVLLTKPDKAVAPGDDVVPPGNEPPEDLGQTFDYLSATEWEFTETAEDDIQTLTPEQKIQSGIVQSLTDEDTYYFSTWAPNPEAEDETLLSVYAYHSNDYTFDRIYRRTYGEKKGPNGLEVFSRPILHVLGQDNNQLVLLAIDYSNSPGPCAESLTFGRDPGDEAFEILSLNLDDPFAKGLEPYRIPDDVYDEALDKQNECQEELSEGGNPF